VRKIAVAMSGGVDSSVAAALLKQEGYDVVGVTMQLTGEREPEDDPAVQSAQGVCETLGIEHKTLDMRDDFKRLVIDYFLDEYLTGFTPNPCVRCNEHVKFGILFKLMDLLRADKLATGHYARVLLDVKTNSLVLLRALDETKDQSYFLYRLTQRHLDRTMFPLGELKKSEVRRIAGELGLPSANREDSQDICFVDEDGYRDFIMKERASSITRGEFVDEDGEVIGEHDGLAFYTIGQRRGLGVPSAEGRLYVVRKDPETWRITLGPKEALEKLQINIGGLNFISGNFPVGDLEIMVKYRNNMEPVKGTILPSDGEESVTIIFHDPQSGIAPGQSAVFYSGERVVGGGVILS